MPTVEFDQYDQYKSFREVRDDEKCYGYIAEVKSTDILFAVVVDYTNYDSYSSDEVTSFVDAFSTVEGAESLALLIQNAFDTGKTDKPVEYENDVGDIVRCGFSSWTGWGSTFKNVAIVRATGARLKHKGILYR